MVSSQRWELRLLLFVLQEDNSAYYTLGMNQTQICRTRPIKYKNQKEFLIQYHGASKSNLLN